MSTTFPDEGEMSSSREPRSQLNLEELPSARSFTSLSTISLANPHILHPRACNPAMDLVALLHEYGEESKPDLKGKGKASGLSTTVVLWRLSGSKVWEAEVDGRVLGLAWSHDGLYLSLVVLRLDQWTSQEPKARRSTVEHLSVHTGEMVKAVPLPPRLLGAIGPDDWALGTQSSRFNFWTVEWSSSDSEWETEAPGSSLSIIESLPKVTPVEPPKPAILNPFAIPVADKKDKGLHSKLDKSSVLLPAATPLPPKVLTIIPPHRDQASPSEMLLTGTFLLPPGTPKQLPSFILGLAQRANSITLLLETVVRGFESMQAVIKDGEKQTFLWRDELEICGEQQGMSVSDVHADLFKFLMAGRGGPAVTEWLGNRLANRAVTKWETTLHIEFTTIQNVLSQSVAPALERILLIFEELSSWARDSTNAQFVLDRAAIARARSVTRGLLFLTEEMRQTATQEWSAAMEWFKWIRYEMARAVSDEGGPVAMYDLKLVWSFMKNGFVSSSFATHFPKDPSAKDDLLPSSALEEPTIPPPDLDKVMTETMSKLLAQPGTAESIASPPPLPDYSFSPTRASPVTARSPQIASSPDTVGDVSMAKPEETTQRYPEREAWAWANTLIAACNDSIGSVKPRLPVSATQDNDDRIPWDSVMDTRVINDLAWIIRGRDAGTLDIYWKIAHPFELEPPGSSPMYQQWCIPDGKIIQAGFFDEDELIVVFDLGGARYLSSITCEALGQGIGVNSQQSAVKVLPIARARPIGKAQPGSFASWQLALNGNKGRRSGWVLTERGTELEVFDMENNEDDEEEEQEEGMETE